MNTKFPAAREREERGRKKKKGQCSERSGTKAPEGSEVVRHLLLLLLETSLALSARRRGNEYESKLVKIVP